MPKLILEPNVKVTMPDGIALATDIYRPDTPQPVPTVLLRTPYGKAFRTEQGLGWARNSFACVVQDVRGRYDSDGAWQPYEHERADGRTMVEWLAGQPWANGQVIPTGGSYAAFTALTAALSAHQAVRALILQVPALGLPLVNFDGSGVLNLAKHLHWWLEQAERRTEHSNLYATLLKAKPDIFNHLPVVSLPTHLNLNLKNWSKVILEGPTAQPDYGVKDSELARLNLPVLHIGGWHDLFIGQTLHLWQHIGTALPQAASRKLIIGPWGHEINQATNYGEREYGPASRLNLGKIQLEWLRDVLVQKEVASPRSEVSFFQMGDNQWREANAWPVITQPEPESRLFYAHSEGVLSEEVCQTDGDSAFDYDPLDPYPASPIPVNLSALEPRSDAVRFTTAPLTVPLSLQSIARLQLYACTDAPDTDWVVRLLEILPDGRIMPVTWGMINTYRATNNPDIAGKTIRYEIVFQPVAITIGTGHKLRLEVTSSNFPEQARNLNTGADRYSSCETRVAHQQISFGPSSSTVLSF